MLPKNVSAEFKQAPEGRVVVAVQIFIIRVVIGILV
jgi:hypothetical protein